MKTYLKIFVLTVALLALALPLSGLAAAAPTHTGFRLDSAAPLQGGECTSLVMGGNCTLEDGDTLKDGLVVMGGNADLQAGSTVEGDVILLGGNLTANGLIEGDIAVIGGLAHLGNTAVVEGDVIAIGGQVQRDGGARIEGEVSTDFNTVFPLVIPGQIQIPGLEGITPFVSPGEVYVPKFDMQVNPVASGIWVLLRSFMWAALAILVVLFIPNHTQRAAQAAASQPLASGGLGCATFVVLPLLIIFLAITICGIPLSLLGLILGIVAVAFGVIAIGLEVGKRLAHLLNQDWAMPVSAGVGTFLLTLVANGIGAVIPCVGWLVPVLVGAVGFGAVLLTRFGARAYPPQAASYETLAEAPMPPAPPVIEPPDEPTEQS